MGGPELCTETDEARELREAYNLRNRDPSIDGNSFVKSGKSKQQNTVIMPCVAGVAHVDLEAIEELENEIKERSLKGSPLLTNASSSSEQPAVQPPTPAAAAEGHRWHVHQQALDALRHITDAGTIERMVTRGRHYVAPLFDVSGRQGTLGRRRRNRSGETETSSRGDSPEPDTGAGDSHEDLMSAAVTAELLHFQLPPRRAAEDAKAAATRSAQNRAEQVTKEQETRLMWRVVMGNAPGLKAEIAKLHATEQAKLALKEYERQHSRAQTAGGRAGSPVLGGRGLGPTPIALPGLGGSPLAAHITASNILAMPQVKVKPGALNEPSAWREPTAVPSEPPAKGVAAPSEERHLGEVESVREVSRDSSPSMSPNSRKHPGGGGMLGWVWSQFGGTARPADSHTHAGGRPNNSRAPKGFDGPFTA